MSLSSIEREPAQVKTATGPANNSPNTSVVIIGAGPAGLTAAYELAKHAVASIVLEADSMVGGLARTAEYKGYLFDMGGHRFFTKVSLVENMWHEVLGADFLTRRRLSRIFYKSKFFHYPLQPLNALSGLGLCESLRCVVSYLKAQALPSKPEDDFETWISNRFGKRLFEIFFKSYTEKVWGIPCNRIQAEWAAQRIRGLSLFSVIWDAFVGKRRPSNNVIKTLIHEFQYPRRGPGMMWQKTREIVERCNSKVLLNSPVEEILWEPGRVLSVVAAGRTYTAEHFISSMAIRDLVRCLKPKPANDVCAAANSLSYRDFLTVVLIIRGRDLFEDNWIYIHDSQVKVGRIQNYNNWSPEMVPDRGTTCLGLEYFCNEGNELWAMSDQELVSLATDEVSKLGLADPRLVIDGTVVRVKKAYPVYDEHYKDGVATVREFFRQMPNLQLVGRNGMHRYNNQDHSMLTAMLAARNVLGAHYDVWNVNVDSEYHEEGTILTEVELQAMEAGQPLVPVQVSRPR